MENAETSRNSGGTSAAAAHQPGAGGGGGGSVAQTRGGMYCERKALRQRGERYGEEDGRGKDGGLAESRSGNLGNRRDVLGFHLEGGGGLRRRLWCERTRSVENRRILKRHQQLRQQLQRNNNNNGNNPAILRSPDFEEWTARARVGAKRARNVKTPSSPLPEFRSFRREKNATQLVGSSRIISSLKRCC